MPSNHFILYCPLLLLPSVFSIIMIFSNESALCIRWPKYWSFSFSISPSNEYSGLNSFRMDWSDLLSVQGTLKSLLQHHNLKAAILRCSLSLGWGLLNPHVPWISVFDPKRQLILFKWGERRLIKCLKSVWRAWPIWYLNFLWVCIILCGCLWGQRWPDRFICGLGQRWWNIDHPIGATGTLKSSSFCSQRKSEDASLGLW